MQRNYRNREILYIVICTLLTFFSLCLIGDKYKANENYNIVNVLIWLGLYLLSNFFVNLINLCRGYAFNIFEILPMLWTTINISILDFLTSKGSGNSTFGVMVGGIGLSFIVGIDIFLKLTDFSNCPSGELIINFKGYSCKILKQIDKIIKLLENQNLTKKQIKFALNINKIELVYLLLIIKMKKVISYNKIDKEYILNEAKSL